VVGQKRPDPSNHVVIDPFVTEVRAEDLGVNIVKPTFDIKKERGDFAIRALEGMDCVGESGAGVKRGERGE